MTPELIAILAVGVALAGVMLQGQRSLGARMDRLDGRMDRLEAGMTEVRERLSRVEAKMDFLESHIVRRDEAGAPAE